MSLESASKIGGGFLSKIKNALNFGKFKMSWKSGVGIVVALLLIGVIGYCYFGQSGVKSVYNAQNIMEGYSGSGGDGKSAELILFHVDWCPHCKTAKPEWETAKSTFDGKKINGYNVVFTDVNCTNETKEIEKMVSTYKIEGYPTIKMIKDGQVIDFDAKPTQSSLTKFINSAI
jgi:thiol-disulfide isomerase/thioredoxin